MGTLPYVLSPGLVTWFWLLMAESIPAATEVSTTYEYVTKYPLISTHQRLHKYYCKQ